MHARTPLQGVALGSHLPRVARGFEQFGSTRTAAKADAIRRFGADDVLLTDGPDGASDPLVWPERVRELAPGGVDLLLDALGAGAVDANLGLLAPYGRMVVYGALDLELPVISARQLYGLRSVAGFSSLGWRAARPDEVRAVMADLTERFRTGRLRLDVTEASLEDPVAAHRLLEDPARVGRVVLTVPQ